MSTKKLFIVAGEASGDMHAARLIAAAKDILPDLRVEGLGGERMQQAGCDLHADIVSTAVMGFVQVVKNIRYFRNLLKYSIRHISEHRPDALVLVDYPGLNMRLAAAAKRLDIPVVYYISPQIWAWRPRRIIKIARLVDKMIVILPFEKELYEHANVDVTYVGHPLLDSITASELDEQFAARWNLSASASVVGLLPGSRKQEIEQNLPVMLKTAEILVKELPSARFLIPCSSRENLELIKSMIQTRDLPLHLLPGKMHEVAQFSRCCIVKSGTATLEVACFLTPLVVVYRTSRLAWFLGRRILNVDHISLVNILAEREVVPEMLQSKMRPDLLAREVKELCQDGERRCTMINELKKLRERLGEPGASAKAARVVCDVLKASARDGSNAGEPEQKLVSTNG
jgi:lipid-A-disaccharide synthase